MFRLAVLTIALCVAFGAAKLFGVSLALGAFFAGMILSESRPNRRILVHSSRAWRSAQERGRPYLVVEAADSALSKMQDQRIETIMEMQCAPMS